MELVLPDSRGTDDRLGEFEPASPESHSNSSLQFAPGETGPGGRLDVSPHADAIHAN
jgi:hypothetical protein